MWWGWTILCRSHNTRSQACYSGQHLWSLTMNGEAQWRHTRNRPHLWLRIGHAESVCVCVCPQLPATGLSVPLVVSPGTKGQRSHTLLRMAAQHCLKIHSPSPGACLDHPAANCAHRRPNQPTQWAGSLLNKATGEPWMQACVESMVCSYPVRCMICIHASVSLSGCDWCANKKISISLFCQHKCLWMTSLYNKKHGL